MLTFVPQAETFTSTQSIIERLKSLYLYIFIDVRNIQFSYMSIFIAFSALLCSFIRICFFIFYRFLAYHKCEIKKINFCKKSEENKYEFKQIRKILKFIINYNILTLLDQSR